MLVRTVAAPIHLFNVVKRRTRMAEVFYVAVLSLAGAHIVTREYGVLTDSALRNERALVVTMVLIVLVGFLVAIPITPMLVVAGGTPPHLLLLIPERAVFASNVLAIVALAFIAVATHKLVFVPTALANDIGDRL